MREILTQTLRDVPDLEGVLLSTQMHGFVLDGVYVSWQDARCLDPLEGERARWSGSGSSFRPG